MPKTAPKLRSVLTTATLAVALLTLVVCATLVVLTSAIHRTTESASASVESVHLAEEAAMDLLLHARASDPIVRADLEGRLDERLGRAEQFVGSPKERAILDRARARLEAYLATTRDSTRPGLEEQGSALAALQSLVTINYEQMLDAQRAAKVWDVLADVVGFAVGGLTLLIAGWLLVWMRKGVARPILGLSAAMEAYARGDRQVVAPESGPAELRGMSRHFNALTSRLAAQRSAQMAFVGGVAHDLRTPLAALKMSIGMFFIDDGPIERDLLERAAERANRQLGRLDRMIGDLLDITRIEADELDLRFQDVDLRTAVRDSVELFRGASTEHPLRVELPDEPAVVRCDPQRMEQVVTNLVSNAVKYSPDGGAIDVVLRPSSAAVVVEVSDHGMGIADADLPLIFEPFRRVNLSQDGIPGTGLGLFIVRRIVEAHGGTIDVQSRPGEGTSFRVTVPTGEASRQPPDHTSRAA